MAFHIREMIMHPDHLLRWILSLFAAMGGFLFLIVKKYTAMEFKNNPALIVHALSLSVLALSIVGGMDYTRLIFLGFPYLVVSILLLRPKTNEFFIAWALSILLSRFWIKMPVISLDLSLYSRWMPESADTRHLVIWTVVMIMCFAIFSAFQKRSSKPAQS